MKTHFLTGLGAALLCLASCGETTRETASITPSAAEPALEARGEYLVKVIGCADCHTPKKMTEDGPVPDMDRYMMGFDGTQPLPPVPDGVPIGPWVLFAGDLTAAVGPWGTSFAANLTPHATGIGNWTFENFRKVMQEGKYKGIDNSRPIMPPMPVEGFKHLTQEDLQAIFAYLKSLKPIDNIVPGYLPPGS